MKQEIWEIAVQLSTAGVIGAFIGFERRMHHKAIGIAGMVMIAIGSTTYMLLAHHLMETDSSSISRTLQDFFPASVSLAAQSFSKAASMSEVSRLQLPFGSQALLASRSAARTGGWE